MLRVYRVYSRGERQISSAGWRRSESRETDVREHRRRDRPSLATRALPARGDPHLRPRKWGSAPIEEQGLPVACRHRVNPPILYQRRRILANEAEDPRVIDALGFGLAPRPLRIAQIHRDSPADRPIDGDSRRMLRSPDARWPPA